MTGIEFYEKRKYVSISSLTSFARCPRKYFYSSGCRLTKGEHPALLFGSAIHNAIPEILSGAGLAAAIGAFDLVWREELKDDKRNRSRAMFMLQDFERTHKSNPLYELVDPKNLPGLKQVEIETQDKVSKWEVTFGIDIGIRVPLVGRIDGIARYKPTGKLLPLEFKTTSSTYNFFSGFYLNPQIIAYAVAAEVSGLGEVEGVVLEALEVSKTKSTTLTTNVSVRQHHKQTFLKWAQFWGNFLLKCEEDNDFPQWYSGCHPYSMFGMPGYQCEFMDLCHSVEDWTMLKQLYEKRESSPFNLTVKGEEVA